MALDLEKIKNSNKLNKNLLLVLTSLYFVMLIWVVIFKCNYNDGLCIEANRAMTLLERLAFKAVPFKATVEAIFVYKDLIEIIALIFNVLCFIPMGVLLRYFMDKKNTLLTGCLVSLVIEIFQLFSCWGGPDIADVILNTVGVYLGALAFDFIAVKLKNRTVNAFAVCIIATVLPIDLFALINSIVNFPK